MGRNPDFSSFIAFKGILTCTQVSIDFGVCRDFGNRIPVDTKIPPVVDNDGRLEHYKGLCLVLEDKQI